MAIARVQTTTVDLSNGTASPWTTAAFSSATTSGNLIVVFIRQSSALDSVTGVTDSAGNTYTRFEYHTDGSSVGGWGYYCQNIIGGSGVTISATTSANASYAFVWAAEYSGVATTGALDTNAHATTNTIDMTVGPFSTSVAGELVFVGGVIPAIATYTAGTDFTLIQGNIQGNSTNTGGTEEYIPAGTLTTYTAHMTCTDGTPGVLLMGAFKPTGGGGVIGSLAGDKHLLSGGILSGGRLVS